MGTVLVSYNSEPVNGIGELPGLLVGKPVPYPSFDKNAADAFMYVPINSIFCPDSMSGSY